MAAGNVAIYLNVYCKIYSNNDTILLVVLLELVGIRDFCQKHYKNRLLNVSV